MLRTPLYQVQPTGVAHETIEREVIAVNLKTGCYFSLIDVAAAVWGRLDRPAGVAEIAAAVRESFAGCPAEIEPEIDTFLRDLVRNELVRVVEDGNGTAGALPRASPGPGALAYSAPRLIAFDDLRDVLELDPVHATGPDFRSIPLAPQPELEPVR